jgi:hypothetical protein
VPCIQSSRYFIPHYLTRIESIPESRVTWYGFGMSKIPNLWYWRHCLSSLHPLIYREFVPLVVHRYCYHINIGLYPGSRVDSLVLCGLWWSWLYLQKTEHLSWMWIEFSELSYIMRYKLDAGDMLYCRTLRDFYTIFPMSSSIIFDSILHRHNMPSHERVRMMRMSVIGIRWVSRMYHSRSHSIRYLWSSWVVPWKFDHYNHLELCLILECRQKWDLRGLIHKRHSSILWSMWRLIRKIRSLKFSHSLYSTRKSKFVSHQLYQSWRMSSRPLTLWQYLRHIVTLYLILDMYRLKYGPRVLHLSRVCIVKDDHLMMRKSCRDLSRFCWAPRMRLYRLEPMFWLFLAYYVADVREIVTLTVSVSFAERTILVRARERRYPEFAVPVPSTNDPISLIVSPPTSTAEKNRSRYETLRSDVLSVKVPRTSSVASCVSVSDTAVVPLHTAR